MRLSYKKVDENGDGKLEKSEWILMMQYLVYFYKI